jgi:hypothetical protein
MAIALVFSLALLGMLKNTSSDIIIVLETLECQQHFFFINTEPVFSMPEVLKKIKAVEAVEEAEMVYGGL